MPRKKLSFQLSTSGDAAVMGRLGTNSRLAGGALRGFEPFLKRTRFAGNKVRADERAV